MRRLWFAGIALLAVAAVTLLVAVPSDADAQPQVTDTALDKLVAVIDSLVADESVVGVEEVQDVAPESTIIYPALDDDVLEAALLTADDLNAAAELDHLGDGWEASEDGVLIEVSGGDHSEGEGLCPEGDDFVEPAAVVSVDLGNDEYPMSEQILSFERSSSADSWKVAYQSCLDDSWIQEGDPDEYMTVESIDIGQLGEESAGFLLLSEHASSTGPEHGDGVALVRISPTVLVKVKLWGDNPPADPVRPDHPQRTDPGGDDQDRVRDQVTGRRPDDRTCDLRRRFRMSPPEPSGYAPADVDRQRRRSGPAHGPAPGRDDSRAW